VGTGLNFEYYPADADFWGVDINEMMVHRAIKRAADRGLENSLIIKADAARLPFDDDYFDIGIITYALSAIPENRKALSELRRVVRKGGKIGIIDFDSSEIPVLGEVALRPSELVSEIALRIDHEMRYPDSFSCSTQYVYVLEV